MIWMLTLTGIVIAFPRESTEFSCWIAFQGIVALLNARLYWLEWSIYRQLRRDFKTFGIEIPPFTFTPLQEREF